MKATTKNKTKKCGEVADEVPSGTKDFPKEEEKESSKKNSKKHNHTPTEEISENNRAFQKAQRKMIYMETDKEPSEILPGFYLGSVGAACNKKALHEYKIKHILCCSDGIEPAYPEKYEYKILKLEDTATENLLQYLEETLTYIHEKISNNEKMLVHCYAGRSRSASIVISYLIKYHGMKAEQALEFVKNKRPAADPNRGFMDQLREFEKQFLPKSTN